MQKKKSFRAVDNPAAAFISSNEPMHDRYGSASGRGGSQLQESSAGDNTPITRHQKKGRDENETKSKRLNLLIRPSLMNDFMKIAYMRRTSVNDLINRLIDVCVENEGSLIEDYDRLFKDMPQS
jgi:hypothetical protein